MDIKVTDKGIRYYAGSVEPARGVVFVFGSNPEGRHGLGAARVAKDRFGARYGVGEGLVGNSYALPTKDLRVTANRGLRSIAPEVITESVKRMYETARQNPDRLFCVAYRNTDDASLNGYTGLEMMDMFNAAGPVPGNVVFSQEWALSGHLDVSLFQEAVPVRESPVKGVSVAIVGGRDFEDYSLVKNIMSQLVVRYDITKVVSGGARGADSLAERWADDHGVDKQVFPADWDRYGRSAGFRRNKDIVANADMVVAFWDGQSRGTRNTMDLTREAGKPLFVVGYGPNKGNDVGLDELQKVLFKDRRLNVLDDILCGRHRYFSEGVERHFEKLNARKDSLDRRLAFPRDTELVFLENGSWVRHGVSGMTVGEVYADLVMKAKEGEGPSRESELWFDERQLTEEGVKALPSYYFEMAYKPLVYYWACLNGGADSLSELPIPDDELAPNGRCLSKALEDMKNEVGLNALRIVHLDGLVQRQTPLEILSFADRPKELKADFKVHL